MLTSVHKSLCAHWLRLWEMTSSVVFLVSADVVLPDHRYDCVVIGDVVLSNHCDELLYDSW